MLETRSEMTLCGVIKWNEDWCEIYCDPYGVLAFETYADGGCWCLTEINIGTPLALDNSLDLCHNIENGVYGDCIGVIYGDAGDVIVLLSEDLAVKRKIWSLTRDEEAPFYYSTDEEYDPEELY